MSNVRSRSRRHPAKARCGVAVVWDDQKRTLGGNVAHPAEGHQETQTLRPALERIKLSDAATESAPMKSRATWPRSLQRMVRPRRVVLTWTDPFDDTILCTEDLAYDARKSAAGYYTRRVKIAREAFKKIWSDVLQGRTPRVGVRIVA